MRVENFSEMSATSFLEFFRAEHVVGKSGKDLCQDETWQRHFRGPDGLLTRVSRSQKFAFGDVLIFGNSQQKLDNLRQLSGTAKEFLANGISVVPFQDCWFEWWVDGPNSVSRLNTACLISDDNDGVCFEVFAREQKRGKNGIKDAWAFTGWRQKLLRDGILLKSEIIGQPHTPEPNTQDVGAMTLALASMAMLLARETKIVDKHPSPGLNVHREKKGKIPLFSHKIVTIDSPRIVYDGGGQSSGIRRASPRLHWRKGRVRTLGSGKKIGIPPCIISAAENGILDKTYRVRLKPEDMHDPR